VLAEVLPEATGRLVATLDQSRQVADVGLFEPDLVPFASFTNRFPNFPPVIEIEGAERVLIFLP
jgi:hypothetical protein